MAKKKFFIYRHIFILFLENNFVVNHTYGRQGNARRSDVNIFYSLSIPAGSVKQRAVKIPVEIDIG